MAPPGRRDVAAMLEEDGIRPARQRRLQSQLAALDLEELRGCRDARPQVLDAARRGDHGLALEEGAPCAAQPELVADRAEPADDAPAMDAMREAEPGDAA